MVAETTTEAAEPKRMTPKQKQAAAWLSVILATAGVTTAIGEGLGFLGPSIAQSADLETKAEAKAVHDALQATDKVTLERLDRIEAAQRKAPRLTYDCIRSKGRNCAD